MRLVPGWDLELLSLLTTAPCPQKSVISFYPPSFKVPPLSSSDDENTIDAAPPPYGPVILKFSGLDEDGMPRISGSCVYPYPEAQRRWPDGVEDTDRLIRQRFAAAGFLLGPAAMLEAAYGVHLPIVPTADVHPTDEQRQWYLPGLFFGEEALLSAALWTRGWEVWVPREVSFSTMQRERRWLKNYDAGEKSRKI
ncbi:hypothetical protein HDU96_005915 [Phlyctochytrium bullatum]|nr:hypothetical protein HDU96_005915 [Phlyctochytrium bullatum]